MAAYAALVSLMNNIEQIQRHTRLPIHFDPKQSESLLEKVRVLIDFLESYNYRGAGEEMKDLESRIRDASYAAEDIIETHVVDTIHAHSRSSKGGQAEKSPTLSCLPGIEKVMEDMDIIQEEAMKLKDEEIENPQPSVPITDPLISSVPAGKNTTVGFDDELKCITERLLAHQPSRQVIPIVGMGGMGKTTLAKTAFEKPYIVKNFDFCAWVSISQDYDLEKIILGLLPKESSQMSSKTLGQTLHQTLYGRRYLIVLDDMWSVEAWEMVQLYLPDNSNGSRIIVTTRESSVSSCFGTTNLEMSFLDEDQSWNLFCEKVFAAKFCPRELEEVGRKIVCNCKGLPLSIVVIGGLLAKFERIKSFWDYIARDTKAIISLEDNEQCMKILSLSYQNLPVHLKPCFLYIGAFPEDKEIRASMLIKLWVAEGFLKTESSKEVEELAETYLKDLISRNLILIHRRRRNGKVRSFMIHDLIRDLCLKLVKNEKFMYASNEMQFIGSHRRISFHKSSSPRVLRNHESESMALTRTLMCDCYEIMPLQKLKLMRVLKCINSGIYSLNDNLMLVNSRLIAISIRARGYRTTIIPSSICLSWNLQILIVKPRFGDIVAPLEIWEMTQLRHLESQGKLYLPDPPPIQQRNTQEDDSDIIMKNLHTLKGIVNFRLSDEVVKRIPNIKKLEISYEFEEMGQENLGLPDNLESLFLTFSEPPSRIRSYLTFPNSLKKLSLQQCGLQWEDMSMIASIPHLEVLKLYKNAFIGPKWVLDEEVFHCLKYLRIRSCWDLEQWIAEDTHFPCLEHLKLGYMDGLVEIPSGIGEIPTLRKIELEYCSNSLVLSANEILKEQVELGNVDLQVSVVCHKSDEVESGR